jgi:GT2 family glycosyltransferase
VSAVTDEDRHTGGRSLPATVVLPTIGRPELVRQCLESLARCDPPADEILVIDSSDDDAVADVVGEFAPAARTIHCPALGIGTAFNFGLSEARHEIVLLTNDDCTVEASWVERGVSRVSEDSDAIVTGRVRPCGDPELVPSTIEDVEAREYSGAAAFVLYTQCMAFRRSRVLEFGGFDGNVQPSAEDNDLSYRWLRAGRRIRYEPDLVVWHHDWRTPEQLERLYVGYGVGQGMVYGKHLRRGDLAMLRHLAAAVYWSGRAVVARLAHGAGAHPDPRLGLLRGLPTGLIRGWRTAPKRQARGSTGEGAKRAKRHQPTDES